MAMGTRKSEQTPMWVATSELPVSPGHPFYARLNAILDEPGFDRFAEAECQEFYAPVMGRPGLPPGRYFRLLLVGYFEGLDSERGIAWRAADSLAVREFVGLGLDMAAPDHSTISRTRRLIALEAHRAVFTWGQERLAAAGLLKGRTVAIDATTLAANAAMRSILRRDTGETYQEFLARLATESGVTTPTRAALARLDRRRQKRTSNTDWQSPSDPDAKITKMKDGRTHLAHKAEHAVDLDSGALVAVTLGGRRRYDESRGHGGDGDRTGGRGAGWHRRARSPDRARRRQGRSQQSDDGRSARHWRAVVCRGAQARPPPVEAGPGRPTSRLRQSPARARGARPAVVARPRAIRGTVVRACLRHRRDAAHPLARTWQHPQTAAGPRERLQSRPPDAAAVRPRHPRGLQGRRLATCSLHIVLRMFFPRLWMTTRVLLEHVRCRPRALSSHLASAIAC